MKYLAMVATAAAGLTSAASATSTIIHGGFTATDWIVEAGSPVTPPPVLTLAFRLTFNPAQAYAGDTAALTVLTPAFPFTLGFSFDPVSQRIVLASDVSAAPCAMPASSFCAVFEQFRTNEPDIVLAAPGSDGVWVAGTVIPGEASYDGSAIPEPASWAMLIAGFGLVGAALRRRTLLANARPA
nr:PEPxxWA-CTERM sorting domain-containing protein [Sandarakinorhabdus rubra]